MDKIITQPVGIFPFWMALAATWDCDSKCTICNLWRSADHTMMDPSTLQRSLTNVFFDGIRNVAFFGGEPTRNDKLPELVSVITKRFPEAEVSVVTNGLDVTRIKDILRVISKKITKDLLVCVSINGPVKRHDFIKGIDGAHHNALETLEIAKTFFNKKPRISLTLLPDFTDEIAHVGWLAQKFETDFSLRCAVSGSYFRSTVDMKWSEQQVEHLCDELAKIPRNLLTCPIFCTALPRFLESGIYKNCEAHRQSLVVSPDLQTTVCHNQPNVCYLGDIPAQWGKAKWWYELGLLDCFKGQECFIDGPYALSYV